MSDLISMALRCSLALTSSSSTRLLLGDVGAAAIRDDPLLCEGGGEGGGGDGASSMEVLDSRVARMRAALALQPTYQGRLACLATTRVASSYCGGPRGSGPAQGEREPPARSGGAVVKTWGPVAGRRGVSGGAGAWVRKVLDNPLPLGAGALVVGLLHLRRITRREVVMQEEQEEQEVALAAGWQVAAYQLLPLRLVSRLWGGMHEITLPPALRGLVLGTYARCSPCSYKINNMDSSGKNAAV